MKRPVSPELVNPATTPVTTEVDSEVNSAQPPMVVLNTRETVLPQLIPSETFSRAEAKKKKKNPAWLEHALVWVPPPKPVLPIPKHPLFISWCPEVLNFTLEKTPFVHKLWISNRSSHSIHVHCCGLWDDTARLGASWVCFPRTRFLISPGLIRVLYIQATPREESPVPMAFSGLQLAAANLRDIIVTVFLVPVQVCFQNYRQPMLEDE